MCYQLWNMPSVIEPNGKEFVIVIVCSSPLYDCKVTGEWTSIDVRISISINFWFPSVSFSPALQVLFPPQSCNIHNHCYINLIYWFSLQKQKSFSGARLIMKRTSYPQIQISNRQVHICICGFFSSSFYLNQRRSRVARFWCWKANTNRFVASARHSKFDFNLN